jgi:hypothetical protein
LLAKDEKTFVQEYGYTKGDGSCLVLCDEIIYLNHSCNTNIRDSGRGLDIVVRDTARGEEATYDYRLFHDSDELAFRCLCGGNTCCETVKCVYPPSEELKSFWYTKISSTMKKMDTVYQPLGKLPE